MDKKQNTTKRIEIVREFSVNEYGEEVQICGIAKFEPTLDVSFIDYCIEFLKHIKKNHTN